MLHQVGVGALGPVYRTYEPTRDRLVAVKVFRLDITPEQARALADELSVAAEAGLFHPSIVEPIAAGVEGTVAYRAEEYVAAESLDVAMRHYAPASVDTALPFLTQIAGAVDFARASGIGHGALHPRDIFVTPDEARATGFGVVEALERVGLRAPVRRPYSAPERVEGGAWTTAADVFSLAVIAYELLTGRRPAGAGDQIGPLTGARDTTHADAIHAVLARAMHPDPGQRHPDALAFVAALESASRGEVPADGAVPAAVPVAGLAGAAMAAPPATASDSSALDEDDAAAAAPVERDEIDEQAQPVEAEQAEDTFRAEEPDVDDILAEQEEDHALHALIEEERTADDEPADRLLFDDEAVEDLALDAPVSDTERFADEFAATAASMPEDEPAGAGFSRPEDEDAEGEAAEADAADVLEEVHEDGGDVRAAATMAGDEERYAPVSASVAPGFGGYADAAEERGRPPMLPIAVAGILGLLVGFVGGYAVGGRKAAVPATVESSTTAPQPQGPESGKPFSEQAVSPSPAKPAEPPPVPPDAAPAREPAVTTPAAAAPATGRIVIRSTPSRAAVTIDGRWRGRTPLTVSDLALGRHEVRIVQPGYATAREAVTLSAAAPSRTVSVRLERNRQAAREGAGAATNQPSFSGSIFVDSRPRGARVLLNGKAMGITPLRIPNVRAGSHVVRLELADHSNWSTTARVAAGQDVRVTGSLERIK